jgi:hypothetical protein
MADPSTTQYYMTAFGIPFAETLMWSSYHGTVRS